MKRSVLTIPAIAAVSVIAAVASIAALVTALVTADHDTDKDPVVGVWFTTAPKAPFSRHMFTFHADGTMGQSNPDGGNPSTSDSDGHGIWVRDGDTIRGKFGEVTANRTNNAFATHGEISFRFQVQGDTFTGTAEAYFFDEAGVSVRGPLPTPLTGKRLQLSSPPTNS